MKMKENPLNKIKMRREYYYFKHFSFLSSQLFLLGFLVVFSLRKSSKTVLLHLGHLGSSSDSMTYMRHLGHPTTTIEVASGLLEQRTAASSWLSSDDTHELGGEVGETEADRFGDESILRFALGGERFSFKSSLGLLPFR